MDGRRIESARRTAPRALAAGAGGLLVALMLPTTAAARRRAGRARTGNNNTYEKLLECVTLEGVREHQAAFQKIADNSTDPVYPGTRAAGTDGTPTASTTSPGCSRTPVTR